MKSSKLFCRRFDFEFYLHGHKGEVGVCTLEMVFKSVAHFCIVWKEVLSLHIPICIANTENKT